MRSIFAACIALALLILCGCQRTTVISREDQLSLLPQTTDAATLPTPTQTAPPATSPTAPTTTPTDSANPQKSPTKTETAAPEKDPPKKNDTKPPETAPPTQATEPTQTTVPTQPTETPTEATTAPTEPETVPPVTEDPYDISSHEVGSLEYGIFAEIATLRGDGSLSLDGYLCAVASVRAYEASQYWSHSRLDGSSYETVFSDYGLAFFVSGELLAQANTGAGAAVFTDAWLGSESHRALLLDPTYTTIGIGVYDYNGMTYVVCLVTG